MTFDPWPPGQQIRLLRDIYGDDWRAHAADWARLRHGFEPDPAARWEWHGRQRRKRERHIEMHRAISPAVRRDVLCPGAVCIYCGGPANVVDHLLPVSRGGTKFRHNLAPACAWCNAMKSAMTEQEFRSGVAQVLTEAALQ